MEPGELQSGPEHKNGDLTPSPRLRVQFSNFREYYQLEKASPGKGKSPQTNLVQPPRQPEPDGDPDSDYVLSKGLFSSVYKCREREKVREITEEVVRNKKKRKRVRYFAAKITSYCRKNERRSSKKADDHKKGQGQVNVKDGLNEIFLLDEIRRERRLRGKGNIFIIELIDAFIYDGEIATILEFAPGGDLQSLLDQDQILYERDVKRYTKQLLTALDFIHTSIGIAHLDVKPQNLLLMGEFPLCDIKLCDFELSRRLDPNNEDENRELQRLMENLGLFYESSSSSSNSLDEKGREDPLESNGVSKPIEKSKKKNKSDRNKPKNLREIVGTPDYVAPEILEFNIGLTPKSDIWSTGVTMYVLLTGFSPFGGDSDLQTFQNILTQEVDFPRELFSSSLSSSTLSIPSGSERDRKVRRRDGNYKNLSAMNLNEYEEVEEIISNECIQVIKEFLHKDPRKRPLASEALENFSWFKQKSYHHGFNRSPGGGMTLARSKEKLNLKLSGNIPTLTGSGTDREVPLTAEIAPQSICRVDRERRCSESEGSKAFDFGDFNKWKKAKNDIDAIEVPKASTPTATVPAPSEPLPPEVAEVKIKFIDVKKVESDAKSSDDEKEKFSLDSLEDFSPRAPPSTPRFTPSTPSTPKFTTSMPSTPKLTPTAPSTLKFEPIAPPASKFTQSTPSTPKLAPISPFTAKFEPIAPSTPKFEPITQSTPKLTQTAPSTPKLEPTTPSTPKVGAISTSGLKLTTTSTPKITSTTPRPSLQEPPVPPPPPPPPLQPLNTKSCDKNEKSKTKDGGSKPGLSIIERRRNTVINLRSNAADTTSQPPRRNSSMTLSEAMALARKEANIKCQTPTNKKSSAFCGPKRNTLISNALTSSTPRSPTVPSTPKSAPPITKKFEDQNRFSNNKKRKK